MIILEFFFIKNKSTSSEKNILRTWPENGPEILWTVDAGDNRILVVGGYELGALMIKVEKQADGSFSTTEILRTEEFGDQTKPPLLIDGYFYAQYGTNNRRDGLVCMNMDGRIMWKTGRNPDFNKGSMIWVDGFIIAADVC